MDRGELLAAFPIDEILEQDGVKLIGNGPMRKALCPLHGDKNPSLSVNLEKGIWFCFSCNVGGSVLDWLSIRTGRPVEEIMRELAAKLERSPPLAPAPGNDVVATYIYRNALGTEVYRVLRYQPKTFKQQRKLPNVDGWAWGMEGVERVLYRLPEILAAKDGEAIWITAGEKDVATLVAMGFNATTNVGGEASWTEGYTQWLQGRDVVVCGDNDPAGLKYVQKVTESLDGKAKRLRVVTIPGPSKDISDWRLLFGANDACKSALEGLLEKAAVLVAGATVPVLSMAEMEDRYIAVQKEISQQCYSFKDWLPTFGFRLRPCVPGDIITFVASTGAGKTAALQNLAFTSGLPTLLFEMELSDVLTFERFVALAMKMRQDDVETEYRAGNVPEWRGTNLSNVHVCPLSGMTAITMENIITRASLKMGRSPLLVLVDYVQLMRGMGKSRYEQMTAVASDIKSIAKNTGTIIVVASQVMRKPEQNLPVGISDGKDSGQIENSSALQIGIWRDDIDYKLMHMRVNKSTRDGPGLRIKCNFDGPTMLISERTEQN